MDAGAGGRPGGADNGPATAVPQPATTTVAAPDPVLVNAAAMVFVADPSTPVVDPTDMRHLVDVLRLRAGESVVVSDGAGRWAPCRVSATVAQGSRRADPSDLLVVDGPMASQPRIAPDLTVAFAPTKGDRPEWVAQKLTELGVDRIVPLRTARSVVRWDGERGTKAVDRLRRVVREAAAQSRRVWLPEVSEVHRLEDLPGAPVLADPGGRPPSLARPVIAIGPEGGWDDAERGSGADTVGLGPTVLRAETAAVVAGALLCALRCSVVLPLA